MIRNIEIDQTIPFKHLFPNVPSNPKDRIIYISHTLFPSRCMFIKHTQKNDFSSMQFTVNT